MRCIISLLIILLTIPQLFAQVPFAQVNQMPLMVTPSMAGAKNMKRICVGFNNQNNLKSAGGNYAFSYDQMFKQTGTGIGFYGLYRTNNDGELNDQEQFLVSNTKNQRYADMSNQVMFGLCFAPKYNVYSKSELGKIKYTYSPSFFLEYLNDKSSLISRLSSKDYFSTIFSTAHPEGVYTFDYYTSGLLHADIRQKSIKAGIGFQVNTQKLLLLYKLGYVYNQSHELLTNYKYDSGKQTTENVSMSFERQFYSIEQSAHVGYSISKSTQSLFSITPMLGFGIKNYLNIPSNYNISSTDTLIYSVDVTNRKANDFNYLHASVNVKFMKLLLGYAYTQYYNSLYKGLSVGYQSNRMKIMCNMSINDASRINYELTSGICF